MIDKKVIIAEDFIHLGKAIAKMPDIFEQQGELLYNGRNKVKAFTIEGIPLVVKRFKSPNIVQRIVYTFFKKSKAERAFLYATMMRLRCILTPKEVAYIEVKSNNFLIDCYFVSLPCYFPPLSSLLRQTDFDRGVARQLGVAIANWHKRGVLHGDLNLTNILYEIDSASFCRFWLIDTNRTTFDNATYQNCINNIIRLTYDRTLLRYVVMAYSEARGWDADKTLADVMKSLNRFEQRKHREGVIKKYFRTITRRNK